MSDKCQWCGSERLPKESGSTLFKCDSSDCQQSTLCEAWQAHKEVEKERDALKARVKELSGICARYEEALVWYADKAQYVYPTHFPEVMRDDGQRARQALGEESST